MPQSNTGVANAGTSNTGSANLGTANLATANMATANAGGGVTGSSTTANPAIQSAPPAARPDAQIDITTETCPMTFVRTRLALDRLGPGQVLRVRLRGEEPARSVPATARLLGHIVLDTRQDGDITILTLQKSTGSKPSG